MRENRTYGSEGGKSGPTGPPYPYQEILDQRVQILTKSAARNPLRQLGLDCH